MIKRTIAVLCTLALVFTQISFAGAISGDKTKPFLKSSTPVMNQTNVARNVKISLKFSENIYKGKYFSKIKITKSGKTITIIKSISKNYLKINHKYFLTYSSNYILFIPANSIKDKAGNILKKAITIKFKTLAKPIILTPTPISTPTPTPIITSTPTPTPISTQTPTTSASPVQFTVSDVSEAQWWSSCSVYVDISPNSGLSTGDFQLRWNKVALYYGGVYASDVITSSGAVLDYSEPQGGGGIDFTITKSGSGLSLGGHLLKVWFQIPGFCQFWYSDVILTCSNLKDINSSDLQYNIENGNINIVPEYTSNPSPIITPTPSPIITPTPTIKPPMGT